MPGLIYFFIVGVGRSGTSLLMSMLNAHTAICMPPETHFVGQYIAKRPYAEFSDVIKIISKDSRFKRLNLDIDEVIRIFVEDNISFSVDRLYISILNKYASKKRVQIIGDKAPKNIEYLPILKKICPTAKVIHIIRDPRDVYLSRKRAEWSRSRNDILQLLAYRSQYSLGRHFGLKLFSENYLEVHYEKLLSNPEVELNRICNLLGIRFDERMLMFSESAKELVFVDEVAWKKETFGPLLKTNMNKWQKDLSSKKVEYVEAACLPAFKDRYYKRNDKSHGVGGFIKDVVISSCMGLLSIIYQSIVRFKNWYAIRAIEYHSLTK